VTGLKAQKSKAIKKTKPVLGYSDISTVKLDFDNTPLKRVKYWAKRVCRFFKLEGFLILNSSRGSYHIVFNRTVSWTKNKHIMDWVALMVEGKRLKNLPLAKYALMQGIKESSCLRIGRKMDKPVPRIVYRFGKEDNEIRNYLRIRRMCRRF
jgi:hypothetical protein